MKSEFKKDLKQIKAFVFDVDGVLTNGNLYVFPGGKFIRKMNAKDGYALKLAIQKGYKVGIITGGRDEEIKLRFEQLGVHEVYLNANDKLPKLIDFMKKNNLKQDQILYMGDDIPDIEVLKYAYVSCCPKNAVNEVKNICNYISSKNGGEGCVRDIIEQTMKVNKKWDLNGKIKY
ncbi:MAG: 3-deoxy-D-manno-octulosonate 8-phosphate phosphatase [Flavobacteriales bacterium]|nr:3-deoxy-D-manno-octulosonate 8-phosphate phosphatase [Flavobacteriales bacterium]|tara:strand:- start:8568 stop:9092 length:525 start_codon:yes stop_codon:yes gene_type:complete